jgi:hypothetical protein
MMTVAQAIKKAERLLPGVPAHEGHKDPRWQAIIAVAEFIDSDADEVWTFALKWGRHRNADLRTSIATCLLEHLLACDFDRIFPRVEAAVKRSRRFADTFCRCWAFDQAQEPANARRFDRLKRTCRLVR